MQAEQKCLLNTDWMGLSLYLDTPLKEPPHGYLWRTYENGTNVWKMRRILYTDRGDKVLTLLSDPKSSLIDPRAALLEIENEWLYHGIGVRGILQLLRRMCIFSVRGMSRMDLAIDFVPSPEQFAIIDALGRNELRVQGRSNWVPWWSVNHSEWMPAQYRGRPIPHQISWGHKTTDVKWKVYYKSKDLKDAAHGMGWDKPYIVDQWREAGFDEYNVWRLEVSIKNCNSLVWNGNKLTLDVWGNNTVAIARDLYTSRFVVRRNQGHKDKSNDDIVDFLPIKGLNLIRCATYEGERVHNGRVALLRQLVKALDDEQVLIDAPSREGVLNHIADIIRRDNLSNYFKGMVGEYFDVWADYIRQQADAATPSDGRYDILLEHDAGRGIVPNAGFNDRTEVHTPVEIVLPDSIKNYKREQNNINQLQL